MKKGITFGAFDLFHAGHVLMMEEAKSVCDYLIVCLQTDPSLDRSEKNSPVQSILERQIKILKDNNINADVKISNLPSDITNSTHVVLPGQGAFKSCIDGLMGIAGMIEALKKFALIQKKDFKIKITRPVIICVFDRLQNDKYIKILKKLRASGISSEIYPGEGKLKKQMEYANKIGSPAVILYGDDEIKSGKATLKNLETGNESSVKIEDLANEIKKLL